MIHKLLGIADLAVAGAFLLNTWFDRADIWFPNKIVLVLAAYLIIKGIFFLVSLDFASIIDIICGIIILLSIYTPIPLVISAIVFIFILQKALFTLIS